MSPKERKVYDADDHTKCSIVWLSTCSVTSYKTIFLTVPKYRFTSSNPWGTPANIDHDRKPHISSRKVPIMQMDHKEFWLCPKADDQPNVERGAKHEKTVLRKKNQTIFQSNLAIFVLHEFCVVRKNPECYFGLLWRLDLKRDFPEEVFSFVVWQQCCPIEKAY